MVEDEVVETFGAVHQRDLEDVVDVLAGDHRIDRKAGEVRDLLADVTVEAGDGAADQRVGLDADAAQFLDRMLGRLGLHLAGVVDVRHQSQVDEHRPLGRQVGVELADRLEEGQ